MNEWIVYRHLSTKNRSAIWCQKKVNFIGWIEHCTTPHSGVYNVFVNYRNLIIYTSGGASKTGVMVEFSDLAFHFRSPGDLTEDEMDDVIDFLHHRAVKQEKTELFQLDLLHESLIR